MITNWKAGGGTTLWLPVRLWRHTHTHTLSGWCGAGVMEPSVPLLQTEAINRIECRCHCSSRSHCVDFAAHILIRVMPFVLTPPGTGRQEEGGPRGKGRKEWGCELHNSCFGQTGSSSLNRNTQVCRATEASLCWFGSYIDFNQHPFRMKMLQSGGCYFGMFEMLPEERHSRLLSPANQLEEGANLKFLITNQRAAVSSLLIWHPAASPKRCSALHMNVSDSDFFFFFGLQPICSSSNALMKYLFNRAEAVDISHHESRCSIYLFTSSVVQMPLLVHVFCLVHGVIFLKMFFPLPLLFIVPKLDPNIS